MTSTHKIVGLILTFFLFPPAIPAFANDDLRDFEHHVRTEDPGLRAMIRRWVDGAPSLDRLIRDLMDTDVIVYVARANFPRPSFEAGLTFVTVAGDRRYLRIEMARNLVPARQLAALGHELHHALEIAHSPGVVSAETMAVEYAHSIGWEREPKLGGRRFESSGAIEMGRKVLKEYVAGE